MRGWHYTPTDVYDNFISKHGIVPYDTDKPEIKSGVGDIKCIFLWVRPLTQLEHLGSVLYHVLHKQTTSVSLLEVEIPDADIVVPPWSPIESAVGAVLDITHNLDGDESSPHYKRWHDETPAMLCFRTIPPHHIRRVGVYDLLDILPEFGYQGKEAYSEYEYRKTIRESSDPTHEDGRYSPAACV